MRWVPRTVELIMHHNVEDAVWSENVRNQVAPRRLDNDVQSEVIRP